MKIKQALNGNLEGDNSYGFISTVLINPESRDWPHLNNLNTLQNQLNDSRRYTDLRVDNYSFIENFENLSNNSLVLANDDALVCNTEYVNSENKKNLLKTLISGASTDLQECMESFLSSSLDNEATQHPLEYCKKISSDNSDMHNKARKAVSRGIVNPNYPGFQHFAHTLQDYTTPAEIPSENEMTDEDNDVDITDLSKEKTNLNTDLMNYENNNNTCSYEVLDNNEIWQFKKQDQYLNTANSNNEIPDLLKNVNPSIDNFCCDIENNFETRDIIGDFNKELEDEIKQVLNYNLNINDDLAELKKDIKDNFSKPIENTINNISDVVNHVIKRLVETQSDIDTGLLLTKHSPVSLIPTLGTIYKEPKDKKPFIEMNRIRPTFLLLETHVDQAIGAPLSDCKDDLNISEDNYTSTSDIVDVETTMKQLSTELRKMIPKIEKISVAGSCRSGDIEQVNTDHNRKQTESTASCANMKTKPSTSPVRCNRESTTIQTPQKDINDTKIRHNYRTKVVRTPRERKITPGFTNSAVTVHKSGSSDDEQGSFDVYNIETALPKLDLDAIESHLKAAKEAERRKRNDREEIRKRLAMGAEAEEYYSLGHTDRPGRKPSLQSRLQSGMNLQICFMNETASDNESQLSEFDKSSNSNSRSMSRSSIFSKSNYSLNNHPYQTRPLSVSVSKHDKISTVQSGAKLKPSILSTKSTKSRSSHSLMNLDIKESDFFALQATLQTEARIALAQAKEIARIQMERERRARPESPVTAMLRGSMEKARAPLPPDRRRVSRHMLTDMNLAQLQVIVNELHGQIEALNGALVRLLVARDDLHMGQDAMLVDIEDLTRYLGVKEQGKKTKGTGGTAKSAARRLTSLVHK